MDIGADGERVQTVVIGAGQAGLSVGYHLARRRLPFLILESNDRIGDTWRNRWDSLRLFTPACYDGLDGWRFPAAGDTFPTKDQMADYLEAYAGRFRLPVRTGTRVERVSRSRGGYRVETSAGPLEAEHVVVAMASYQAPRIPAFAADLDPAIVQLHSRDYRNPSVFRDGGVLVVGAGNSGAEIAMEAARAHRTWISGRDTGHVPFRVEGFVGRRVLVHVVFRLLFHRVLTVKTPLGRKVRQKVLTMGGPLIRNRPAELAAAGIERVPRLTGVRDGRPHLSDGRVLDVANVVWCTGFHNGLSWIDLPVFDGQGEPRHEHGFVPGEPGLYFVGLHFLYAFSSAMIHGVGRDADRIAEGIARRVDARLPAAAAAA
jgi:putative flavoprotein involved in K+ transport